MPIYSNFYQTLTTACPIVELRGYAAACGLKGHLYAYLDFYGPTGTARDGLAEGMLALAIFTFVNTWNDYFMQLIMLKSSDAITVSLGIARLQSEFATNYGLMMAGATLGAVPIVAVFICFQKYFTQGITMGAVKG